MLDDELDWGVYVVTDHDLVGSRPLPTVIAHALAGGASVVQLRNKHRPIRELYTLGLELRDLTRAADVPFIVNDRLDLALALNADGVHVGQDDLPAEIVRRVLGPHRILGVSVETVAQAEQAALAGATYLGVGAVYATSTKPDANAPIGLDTLAAIVQATPLPCVAIGGITLENAAAVLQTGVQGVAVVSAIMGAADPQQAARSLRELVQQHRRKP